MKQYMTVAILMLLLDGKTYTSKQLSEKFEVSNKTIFRCIETLTDAGLPIVSKQGINGGYKLSDTNRINCSFFTIEELSSFFSFLKSNQERFISYDNDISERLKNADLKLANNISIKSQQIVFDTDAWGTNGINKYNLDFIKNAITTQNKLKITYKTAKMSSIRIIHPHTLVFKYGIWYVYAYCEKRENFRLFKVSKIDKIELLNVTFIRQNVDCLLKPWNKDFEKNFKKIDATFKVNRENINDIYDWLGNNFNILQKDDNSVIFSANLNYCEGLIHKLLELGNKITVISPKYLIDDIFSIFESIKNNYIQSIESKAIFKATTL